MSHMCSVCKVHESVRYDQSGDGYCSRCYERLRQQGWLHYCADCGDLVKIEDRRLTRTHRGSVVLCNSCRSKYIRCVRCGCYEIPARSATTREEASLCSVCRESYIVCPRCGSVVSKERAHYFRDTPYCCSCAADADMAAARREKWIADYHDSHFCAWYPYVAEHEARLGPRLFEGYGFELETERSVGSEYLTDVIPRIQKLDKHSLFSIERDGSLSHGFELVSRPFTRAAWGDVLETTADIMSLLSKAGYVSGSKGCNCGLHFHVSKTMLDTEAQAKLLMLASAFEPKLVKWSRRTYSDFMEWAPAVDVFSYIYMQGTSKQKVRQAARDCTDDKLGRRHVAINTCPAGTVEFRFFKGTLAPEYLEAGFEFVNFLVDIANNTSAYGLFRMTERSFMGKAKSYSPILKKYITAAEKKSLPEM